MPCCDGCQTVPTHEDRPSSSWRRALVTALGVNLALFVAEMVLGAVARSVALQADALDFLGDAANFAISLGVVGMAREWRSRAALAKGITMLAFAVWVVGMTAWHAWTRTLPHAATMGIVGVGALAANGGRATMLSRFRGEDANMRAVWICARNDAIGNAAVLLAAIGVFGTGTGWPDVVVAGIMAALGFAGGTEVLRQASRELRAPRPKWSPVSDTLTIGERVT